MIRPLARRRAGTLVAAAVALGWMAEVPGGGLDLATPAVDGAPSSFQQEPAPPNTAAIVGQVVDAATGQPIPGAMVVLSGTATIRVTPDSQPSPAEIAAMQAANAPRRVIASASGMFVFHSLAKGSYRLSSEVAGYLPGSYGQLRLGGPSRQITVDQGERRTGIVIRMWQYGSLGGTILDEHGDPAVGLSVSLVRLLNGDRRAPMMSGSTQTDDRGAYRFRVTPGDYLVVVPQSITSVPLSAVDAWIAATAQQQGAAALERDLRASNAPQPSANGVRFGDQQIQFAGGPTTLLAPPLLQEGRTFAYQTLYYPASTSSVDAGLVQVGSGQERTGLDMQLRMVLTARLSGRVIGPDGPAPNMGVRLVGAGISPDARDMTLDVARTMTDAMGAFTFPAVPAGSHTILVLRTAPAQPPPPPPPPRGSLFPVPTPQPPPAPDLPTLWAELPVMVGEEPISAIDVVLRPGSRVSGRVVFDGARPAPAADAIQRLTISIIPAGPGGFSPTPTVRPVQNGQFTTHGLPPGRYRINASALDGWYLTSVTWGTTDVRDEPLLVEGTDLSGVTLRFTDRTTQISGTVTDPGGPQDLAATVFLFPAGYATLLDRHGTVRTTTMSVGGAGTFSLTNTPAGDYVIVAVSPEDVTEPRDRAFYDRLARVGTRFTLGEGERKTIALDLRPIGR